MAGCIVCRGVYFLFMGTMLPFACACSLCPAIASTTRHSGVAVIVATACRGPRTVVLLAAYVVASVVVSIPYLQWRRRQAHGEEPIMGGA